MNLEQQSEKSANITDSCLRVTSNLGTMHETALRCYWLPCDPGSGIEWNVSPECCNSLSGRAAQPGSTLGGWQEPKGMRPWNESSGINLPLQWGW